MIRWIRKMLWCSKGAHRPEMHIDHAALTFIRCKDCDKRFKFGEFVQSVRAKP